LTPPTIVAEVLGMLTPLLGFVLWTLLLLAIVVLWRGVTILRRERRIQDFPSGDQHGSPMYWRVNRAHMNALENLPLFATLVFATLLTVEPSARAPFETAAQVVLGARVAQSTIHVVANSAISVSIRFTFFFLQICAFAFMAVMLLLR
jgi:uncharacterized MAPEG superfamily protein